MFSQASVLGLYDPDRAQAVTLNGEIRGWGDFFGAFRAILADAEGQERRGHPHPHRDGDLADHGRAVRGDPEAISRRRSGISGNRPGRTARAPARCRRFGQPVNTYYDLTKAERRRVARFRFPGVGRRQPALRAAVRRAPPRERRQDDHEPALRGGADAHPDRRQGRPSPAAARGRRGRVRLGAGDRASSAPTARRRATTATSINWAGASRATCCATRARAWSSPASSSRPSSTPWRTR